MYQELISRFDQLGNIKSKIDQQHAQPRSVINLLKLVNDK